MDKKYLAKILAKDNQGLKVISACCYEAKIKINELKYLKKNLTIPIKIPSQRFVEQTLRVESTVLVKGFGYVANDSIIHFE